MLRIILQVSLVLACALPEASLSSVAQRSSNEVARSSFEADNLALPEPNVLLDRLQTFWGRATSEAAKALDKFWKPRQECIQLVQRYHKFYTTYATLVKSQPQLELAAPNDLIAVEFASTERRLFEELLPKEQMRLQLIAGQNKREENTPLVSLDTASQSLETSDFLFEALKRLIDRLEVLLIDLQRQQSIEGNDISTAPRNKQQVEAFKRSREFQESMDRLKRIGAKMVRGMLAGELLQVSRIATLNALATYFAVAPPVPGSPLSALVPLVQLLGAANTPLAASYLTNVEIRTVIGLLDDLNPVPRLVTGLFKNQRSSN